MQPTRQLILDYLRSHGEATVRELGDYLELTATGVRQHLTILGQEDLVASREKRGKVGRPALVYALSSQGEATYPQSYDRLAVSLLDEIRERHGAAAFQQLIRGVAVRWAAPHVAALTDASPEERLEAACQMLRDQNVIADWERVDGAYLFHQRTCPYPEVARHNAAVCVIDVHCMREITGMDARLTECRVRGDECCTYRLEPSRIASIR